MMRKHVGDNVEIIWTLVRGSYNNFTDFAFKFKAHNKAMEANLFRYDISSGYITMQNGKYQNRIKLIKNGDTIGFQLLDVSQADAGQYICQYSTFNNVPESQATLFIYGKHKSNCIVLN